MARLNCKYPCRYYYRLPEEYFVVWHPFDDELHVEEFFHVVRGDTFVRMCVERYDYDDMKSGYTPAFLYDLLVRKGSFLYYDDVDMDKLVEEINGNRRMFKER